MASVDRPANSRPTTSACPVRKSLKPNVSCRMRRAAGGTTVADTLDTPALAAVIMLASAILQGAGAENAQAHDIERVILNLCSLPAMIAASQGIASRFFKKMW